MTNNKALAMDIYFELKELEDKMKHILVIRSIAHSDPEFMKLHKQYFKKREKWWPFIEQNLVIPTDLPIPTIPCSACGSKEYWQTKFQSIVCSVCYPPENLEQIEQLYTVT